MLKQALLVTALMVALLFLLLLGRGSEQPEQSVNDLDPTSMPTPRGVPEERLRTLAEGTGSIEAAFRLVDRLSNRDLPDSWTGVLIERSGSRVDLGPDSSFLLRGIPGISYELQYPAIVLGEAEHRMMSLALDDSTVDVTGKVVRVPFRSKVVVSVADEFSALPAIGVRLSLTIVDPDEMLAARTDPDLQSHATPFPPGGIEVALAKLRAEEGSAYEASAVSDEAGIATFYPDVGGLALIRHHSQDFRIAHAELFVSPGREYDCRMVLKARPRIGGAVVDHDGRPIPEALVSVRTLLFDDGERFDFSSEDKARGLSFSGVVDPGRGTADRVSAREVRTDENGRFSCPVPFGEQYCVEVKMPARYMCRILDETDFDQRSIADLSLTMDDPTTQWSAGEVPSVLVQSASGQPLRNIEVMSTPHHDRPWLRVFPRARTDEDGIAYLPWLREVESAFIVVEGDNMRGMHGDVIPVTSSMVITVPNELLRQE